MFLSRQGRQLTSVVFANRHAAGYIYVCSSLTRTMPCFTWMPNIEDKDRVPIWERMGAHVRRSFAVW